MNRYRLIKPEWGRSGSIKGPNVIEGVYNTEYITQKNNDGYNVYFFPNYNSDPIAGKFLSGRNIDVYRQVFIDMDLKDGVYASKEEFVDRVAAFPIRPNRVVDSGNGIHVYWNIADLDRDSFVELQFRLINEFKTDASVWTVLQLMRVPGSINTKKEDDRKLANIIVDYEGSYTVTQLRAILPELETSQVSKKDRHVNKLDGIYDKLIDLDALDNDELPASFAVILGSNQEIRGIWDDTADRSKSDWTLGMILCKNGFTSQEVFQILVQSSKARSKANHRRDYARSTVGKIFEHSGYSVQSVADRESHGEQEIKSIKVKGPEYIDCTSVGWRKGEVLGMIAGSGVGKTAITLDIFYEMMRNNPDNDDIYIFYSLEMQDFEIIERWKALVGSKSPYSARLFVVSNEEVDGSDRHIDLQKLYWYAEGIKNNTGKKVASIAIDHIGILATTVDIAKEPTFGVTGDDVGFGTLRTIPFEALCAKMKSLAKKLNCFLILQSQTTKEKAGDGDTELGIGAAFGTAKFEWYVDYIITLWQPLRRVESDTDLRVTGWQYCKIRNKRKDDPIKIYDKRVLAIDMDSGKFRPLLSDEMDDFEVLEKDAAKKRSASKKDASEDYKNSEGGIKKLRAIINTHGFKEAGS